MFNRIVLVFNAILLGMNIQEWLAGTADGFDYTFMGIQIILILGMVFIREIWRMD